MDARVELQNFLPHNITILVAILTSELNDELRNHRVVLILIGILYIGQRVVILLTDVWQVEEQFTT
jgi:hypothetical protein